MLFQTPIAESDLRAAQLAVHKNLVKHIKKKVVRSEELSV